MVVVLRCGGGLGEERSVVERGVVVVVLW